MVGVEEMLVNEALNCKFRTLAKDSTIIDGEYNPCFVINRRSGQAFDYVICAMDQYYERAPDGTKRQIISNLNKWSYWLEAVFFRFLVSSGANIELRYSVTSSNPDYFIARSDAAHLVLDCKYKKCLTDRDKLYVSNTNELQASVVKLLIIEPITVVADFDDSYLITNDDATNLAAFLSNVMPSIKVGYHDVAIPFPAGEGFIRRSLSKKSIVNLRAVDCETSINVSQHWITEIKKQHKKHSGDLVGCFYIDTGMFTKSCPNEQLWAALQRQTTVKMLMVFAGSHPGEMGTKGVTVITRDGIHKSVMSGDLRQYLN